ncbi:EmrB/QacA subfamily drug resistance transporter [Neorhizobium alkalisoli]|uniref:EmrB/QacA subfamily drug resistance transporter n=2 Tax=Neorhizobium alkalisoli TaxID=528178 RepID=A0A561R3A3_9HYPH|nr:MDR family MFS transporter [Neorhizobium alkalisoli]TWF57079.1 EmrB/QacA subfamily drug resistance transporter [Neorhizobium alkalisoli]
MDMSRPAASAANTSGQAAASSSVSAPAAPPAFEPLVADHRQKLAVFWFLMAALFMATLDNQIVSTALPTIVGEFGQMERFGWVTSAFLLATSAVMPIYGKLGDLFGRKYVMLFAIILFTVGSVVCGFAWSMDSLVAARILQGLGGGGIMVSIFSINADLFEPRERAKYQSYSSLMIMASGSIGPVLGGTMSDLFGWRSIFLINVPIGVIVVSGIALLLPYRRPQRRPKIDYAGAVLLAATIASLVAWADSRQIFGSMVAPAALGVLAFGIVCAGLWTFVESRVPEPIIPLKLFRDSTFSLYLIVTLCSGAIAIGMVNYYALFLQTTTGLSPSTAGLFFIGLTGGIVIGSMSAGRLISITGRYKPFSIIGLTMNVSCLFAISQIGPHTPLYVIAGLLLLQGMAIGFGQQAPIIGVQNSAPRSDIGAATGAVTLMRMGGASIAISVYGAIIGMSLKGVTVEIPGVPDIAALTPKLMAELPESSRMAIATVYYGAFTPLFLTATAIAAIGLIAALCLKPKRLPPARLPAAPVTPPVVEKNAA